VVPLGEPAPRRRTRCIGGLTPHGDGAGPGVVKRRPTLAAIPAGGTSTVGAAAPTSALAVATTSVDGGSRTRGRRCRGRGPSGGPGRRSAGGLSPGRRLCTRGGAVECWGKMGASIVMVSSSRSSFRTTWKMGKGTPGVAL
jgi:hypothetical protein